MAVIHLNNTAINATLSIVILMNVAEPTTLGVDGVAFLAINFPYFSAKIGKLKIRLKNMSASKFASNSAN
jgi:hypothetical protein